MSWLISQALMNSLSLPERVEESLEGNSLDGEQCVPSNGNPTQQAYCAPDKMTVFSRLSQFGMTYKPLTESRGQELLTLYLEAFHAKTSQPQVEVTGLRESDQECGNTWRGWLAKFDPDSCLWRIAQCSLLEEELPLLQTLPRWGTTHDGLLWEQQTLEPSTKGTGCGFLPTPCARDGRGARSLQAQKRANRGATNSLPDYFRIQKNWQYPPVAVVEYMMGWPLGWTDLKPLEMDKFHCVQQQPSES